VGLVRGAFVELRGSACSRSWHVVVVDDECWPGFKRIARRWGSVPYELARKCGMLLKWYRKVSYAPAWACADGPMLFESVPEMVKWFEECLWGMYARNKYYALSALHTLMEWLGRLAYVYGEQLLPGMAIEPVHMDAYDPHGEGWVSQALSKGTLLTDASIGDRVYELRGSYAIRLVPEDVVYFIYKGASPPEIAECVKGLQRCLFPEADFFNAVLRGARSLERSKLPGLAEHFKTLLAQVMLL
jgi:hypothetical protein